MLDDATKHVVNCRYGRNIVRNQSCDKHRVQPERDTVFPFGAASLEVIAITRIPTVFFQKMFCTTHAFFLCVHLWGKQNSQGSAKYILRCCCSSAITVASHLQRARSASACVTRRLFCATMAFSARRKLPKLSASPGPTWRRCTYEYDTNTKPDKHA